MKKAMHTIHRVTDGPFCGWAAPRAHSGGAMDSAILLAVAKKRTPSLMIAAVDVTAVGSVTLVVLFSVVTLVVLLVLRD